MMSRKKGIKFKKKNNADISPEFLWGGGAWGSDGSLAVEDNLLWRRSNASTVTIPYFHCFSSLSLFLLLKETVQSVMQIA